MKLWSHQSEALRLAKPCKGFALFHDMGTGKTCTALTLIKEWSHNFNLVVCPKKIIDVWAEQAEKFYPGQFVIAPLNGKGTVKEKAKLLNSFSFNQPTIIILNYDIVWRSEIEKFFLAHSPHVVIADESHRAKSPGSQSSRALARIGRRAHRRLCLTGTPLPHSPLDIYGQYRFLDPSIFGTSFVRFRSRYAVMGGYEQKQVIGWVNQEELQRKMYSIAHRVRSDDVQDLPETLDVVVPFELSAKGRKAYDQLDKEFVAYLDQGEVNAAHVLTKLLRLQQLTGGWLQPDEGARPVHVDSGKLETLADIIDGTDEPIVIFCQFHAEMDGILKWLAKEGKPGSEISGRKNELYEWKEGGTQVLVVQIKAGGEGIDLTRARYCVFYSTGFSLGAVLQARKRVHRPGQSRKVTYYHLVAKNTIDEKIAKALEKREDLVKTIVERR